MGPRIARKQMDEASAEGRWGRRQAGDRSWPLDGFNRTVAVGPLSWIPQLSFARLFIACLLFSLPIFLDFPEIRTKFHLFWLTMRRFLTRGFTFILNFILDCIGMVATMSRFFFLNNKTKILRKCFSR